MVLSGLSKLGLDATHIQRVLNHTTQSLILFNPTGKRMIFNDLKDIQDQAYSESDFIEASKGCAAAVLCNLNFNRPLLLKARQMNLPIITDVHVISDPLDAYNKEFMSTADVLFVSNEFFSGHEKEFARDLIRLYDFSILVIGMGSQGAMVYERATASWHQSPTQNLRPVKNTVGAGDSLSACFVDGWLQGMSPQQALDRACYFASWKVGVQGAAEGFLSTKELIDLQTSRRGDTF